MNKRNLRTLGRFLLERAQEPGSIRQVAVVIATLAGRQIAPDMADAIGWVGFAAAVLVGILTRENPPPPMDENDA
jgi:hypothetical protein